MPVDRRVAEISQRIKETWLTVAVLGPPKAQIVASRVRDSCNAYRTTILACQGSDAIHLDNFWMHRTRPDDLRVQGHAMIAALTIEGEELHDLLQSFISAAQSVLDDDGSKRLS